MIDDFPSFKPLQLGDRAALQRLTRRFPPYSDFNFTSLYSWDTNEAVRVSVLNGNLVVRFTDYTTNEPFYSFLGDIAVDETATKLLELARSEGILAELKLVPEVSAWRVTPGEFVMREDDDNFDYILSIDKLKSYQGNKLGPKRNFVNRFNKSYEAATVEVNLADVAIQTRFLDLFHRWTLNKGDTAENAENELLALHRVMFAAGRLPDLYTVATFIGDDLAGFSINEILGNGYAMIHFEKADAAYTGIYAQLMQQMACLMSARDCRYINYEQDLGVSGLRKGKSSYIPSNYLRKYALRLVTESTRPGPADGVDAISPYFLLSGNAESPLRAGSRPLAAGEWSDMPRGAPEEVAEEPRPSEGSRPTDADESELPSSKSRYSIPPSSAGQGLNLPPLFRAPQFPAEGDSGPTSSASPASTAVPSRPPVKAPPLGGLLQARSGASDMPPSSLRSSTQVPASGQKQSVLPPGLSLRPPPMPRIEMMDESDAGDPKSEASPSAAPPTSGRRGSNMLPPPPGGNDTARSGSQRADEPPRAQRSTESGSQRPERRSAWERLQERAFGPSDEPTASLMDPVRAASPQTAAATPRGEPARRGQPDQVSLSAPPLKMDKWLEADRTSSMPPSEDVQIDERASPTSKPDPQPSKPAPARAPAAAEAARTEEGARPKGREAPPVGVIGLRLPPLDPGRWLVESEPKPEPAAPAPPRDELANALKAPRLPVGLRWLEGERSSPSEPPAGS